MFKRRMAPAALLFWVFLPASPGTAQDASKIDAQIIKLNSPGVRPAERHAAMRALIEAGKDAESALCGLIEKADRPFVRHTAAATLREILRHPGNRDEALLPRLESMVRSKDPILAAVGPTIVMEYRGNQRARAILKEAAKRQSDERLRAGLMDALAYHMRDDKDDIQFLAEFLKDRSDFVRIAAAGALGKLGDKRGAKLCEEILNRKPANDKSKQLQLWAANAAYSIKESSLIPALRHISSSTGSQRLNASATRAIKETELAAISDDTNRLQYLRQAIADAKTARWAAMHLIPMEDQAALGILKDAAENRDVVVSREARFALRFRESSDVPKR